MRAARPAPPTLRPALPPTPPRRPLPAARAAGQDAPPSPPSPPPPPAAPSLPPAALAAVAAVFGAALAVAGRPAGPSLADVAALAVPLDAARASGRPSVVEFYTPYCDVCKSLAPDAAAVASAHAADLNYVLLNADNPKWAPEVAEWGVRGVPHFVFLGRDGAPRGAAVGRLPRGELEDEAAALIEGRELPLGRGREGGVGVGETTPLRGAGGGAAVGPRDHGP